jgi:hypothetical protein
MLTMGDYSEFRPFSEILNYLPEADDKLSNLPFELYPEIEKTV